jgi:hypothetical protein
MSHPDSAKLTQHATRDAEDVGFDWHVANCPECAAELEGLRAAHDDLLRAASALNAPGPDCLDEHLLAAIAGGDLAPHEREPLWRHLSECAHCRRVVASVASALASEDVREATAHLAAPGRRRWIRFAVPLGAAAALLVLFTPRTPVSPPEHRDSPTVSGTAPVAIAPTGVTTAVRVLRWHPVPGADRYRVTVFDDGGGVVWEGTLSDTVAALPEEVPLEAGRAYYWIVAARTGFDRWDTSALVEFSIVSEPSR